MLGNFLPIAIVCTGGYFLVRLRAFFFFHPMRTASLAKREYKKEGKGAFTRLSLALAGTLGVGNVTGVAVGILVGGAGSVFWILISALFSAPLKYAESVAVLSVKDEKGKSYGFVTLVRSSFSHIGTPLSVLYALLCVGLAFFMGSALQSAAAAETASALGKEEHAMTCAFAFAILFVFCVLGNADRICKATSVLIPIAMIIYTIICVITLLHGMSRVEEVVKFVLKDAFSSRAFFGGAVGTTVTSPLKEGFFRGLLSNEAGAGTSAFAHAKSVDGTPFFEGVLGMAEILFDTVILCMLTAFAILVSVKDLQNFQNGMDILSAAFSSALGARYRWPLLLSVFLFAVSSAVCWYEYGRCALGALGCNGGRSYFIVYLGFSFLGVCLGTMALIPLCDALLFFLSAIALPTLMKNRAAVCAETDRALGIGGRSARPRTAANIKIR